MSHKTLATKDQLRLLKNAARIPSALKSYHRQHSFDGESVISPSRSDSECSTLVDFTTGDNAKDLSKFILEEEEGNDYRLEEENTAWMHESRYQQKKRRQQTVLHPHRPHDAPAQMLDEEDRAWTMPSKPIKNHTKATVGFLNSFTGRRHKTPTINRSGIQAEYLDPEDRAWV
ncbi:hypothetical protein ABKN59_008047 [Abortiporus biennis]